MNRVYMLTGLLAAAVVVTGAAVNAEDKEKKKPVSIKAVMKFTHGKEGCRAKASAALKEKDFEALGKIAKVWLACAENLEKNEAPKGDKESWAKLSKTYCKCVSTLAAAAEKKDGKKAAGALGAIGKSCGECHKEHKP